MSIVKEIMIQGIRSFGPSDSDAQKLKFITPLTLILGQNGSGKTTIIESLKYATCGELPTNCKNGGFIRDPNLVGQAQVLGQIRLKLKDCKGKEVTVCRTIQATRRASKLEFKSLDQTITRIGVDGKLVSISGRCVDVDAELRCAFGVSKPILNYVIFCHQEDSSWPLDEGKKVKERFDAIFDTVKYNKCLEQIRKMVKEMGDNVRFQQKEIIYIKQQKEEALEKTGKLRESEQRMIDIAREVQDFDDQLEPIRNRIKDLASKEMNIAQLMGEHASKKSKLESIRASIQEYKEGIKGEFQGSMEDLKSEIENFNLQFNQQQSKLEGLEAETEKANMEEKNLNKSTSDEQLKLGQLSRDAQRNKEKINQRNKSLQKLTADLGLVVNESEEISEGDFVRSIGNIERKIMDLENEMQALGETGERNERNLQEKIDALREERARLEQEKRAKNQLMKENRINASKLKREVDEVNQSTEKLSRLEERLNKVNKDHEEVSNSLNVEQLDQTVKEKTSLKDSFEETIVQVDKEVQITQMMSSLQAELDLQKDAKSAREADIRKLKNKHEDTLKHLLTTIPEYGIKHQLQACLDKLSQTIKTKQHEMADKQKELTTLETERKHQAEKLKQQKQLLAEDEEEMYDVCGSKDYESVLQDTSSKLLQLQEDRGILSTSESFYKRYVSKLQQSDPCCPLCHRGFQGEDDAVELVQEITSKLKELPSLLQRKVIEVTQVQEKQNRLQQLRPTYERIDKLKNTEIPSLKTQLSNTEKQLQTTRENLTTLQEELMGPQADEVLCKSVQGDAVLLDQHQAEVRKLDKEIEKIQAKLPLGGSSRSLKEALDEQAKIRSELTTLRKSIETLQSKKNTHNHRLHQLQAEKNRIVEEKLKIQGGVQKKKQLEDELAELQGSEIVLMEQIDDIDQQIVPVTDQLEATSREKEQLRNNNKILMNKERQKVNELQKRCEEIRKIQKEVTDYDRSGGALKLSTTQQNLSRLQKEKDFINAKKADLQNQMDEIKSLLSNQQGKLRELNDNIKLRLKKEEELEVESLVEDLRKEIGNLDYNSLAREKLKLSKQEENIIKQKAHIQGRQKELEQSIESLNDELNRDPYKNANKHYRDSFIKLKVEDTARNDLNHYYKAMEWAMIQFHREKMERVNKIIKNMWTSIYSGNDIDYISIKTDEDTSGSAEKRKTYNYRVVQYRNKQEMDMRGRCSAGQKVLACLIIRMALAEVFSSSCGVLALDEPTTNLDEKHTTNLSESLAEIINMHSLKNSNFQLIIITHDDSFLGKLTRVCSLENYYKVERAPESGCTRVSRCSTHH